MKRAIVYGVFVDDRLRYCGQSFRINPEERFGEHLGSARTGRKGKCAVGIRSITDGQRLEFRIISELPVSDDHDLMRSSLDAEERRVITEAWDKGDCDWNVSGHCRVQRLGQGNVLHSRAQRRV